HHKNVDYKGGRWGRLNYACFMKYNSVGEYAPRVA
ncbi:hypothetical protein LCGC14_2173040, partial [marine sediment metagenome]